MSIWIDLATKTYDVANELGLWKLIRQRLRRKKRILVLGASGVGKTQLIQSLIAPMSTRLTVRHRTVSVRPTPVVIDEFPFVMVDTPGQRLDEAKRKKAIQNAVKEGVSGIINVVCFGYHEAQESGAAADAVSVRGPSIARAEYLQARRRVELELLSEWNWMVDEATTPWVLTLATKADLWWPDEARIREYYEAGPYAEALQRLASIPTVLPYCAVIEPFYRTKTSGRFGDSDRAGLRGHLLQSILNMTGGGA